MDRVFFDDCHWHEPVIQAKRFRVRVEREDSSRKKNDWVYFRLCAMFFVLGMGPGFWMPGLTNIIKAAGWGNQWVALIFLIFPTASMITPLFSGALADQKVAAQKLAGWLCLAGTMTMVAAFWCLHHHLHPWYFVGLFFLTSVIGAPIWNLVITVALTHLPSPEQQFPKVRLWCTLGWILAGVMCSLVFHADASPLAGYVGAAFRLLLAAFIFILPHTPPRGVSRSWRSLMGFDAFRFDNTKGYSGEFTSMYIHATDPVYSVSEFYDSNRALISGWLDSSGRYRCCDVTCRASYSNHNCALTLITPRSNLKPYTTLKP